jgi:hypothetical protein
MYFEWFNGTLASGMLTGGKLLDAAGIHQRK